MKLFKKRWGKWTDISVGQFDAQFYCLQVRRSVSGKIQFRVASSKCAYGCPPIKLSELPTV